MEETTKQIAEGFQCTYKVFEKGTAPELVEQAYLAALERGRAEGFYPAIVSIGEYGADWLAEAAAGAEGIIAGCEVNGKEILEERFQEYMEEAEDLDGYIGEETEGETVSHFSGYISFHDRTLESDTLLLELPVKNPWELIGYLPMGGWNECPAPEDMISICKYWYEKYQAIPAVFTQDVMEFYAPKCLNGADSLEAAKEHYAFCTDRVDQGTETGLLSELAAGLEHSTVWYFWWD